MSDVKYSQVKGESDHLKSEDAPLIRDKTVDSYGTESPLALGLGIVCFPFTLLCSWYTVRENNEAVILQFGRYAGVETNPGLHFYNCCGREIRTVTKQKQTLHVPITKIVDKTGNPLHVSGIVVFSFLNSKKCAIDVTDPHNFTLNSAQTVLKIVCGRHPYATSKPGQLCLKSNASQISRELADCLQKDVQVAGVIIISFQFNDLSYAPEIASAMLKKAQAQALVAARKKIVDGALDIALGAIDELDKRDVKISNTDKSKIVTNLLTVICSDQDAKPTVNVTERH